MSEEFVDFVAEKEPEIIAQPRKKTALNRISLFLTNKFFITTVVFLAVMLFLDKNDLLTTLDRRAELQSLEASKEHYNKELIELRKIKTSLETDPVTIEKVAREKYLMHRNNEDIFLTEDISKPGNE